MQVFSVTGFDTVNKQLSTYPANVAKICIKQALSSVVTVFKVDLSYMGDMHLKYTCEIFFSIYF